METLRIDGYLTLVLLSHRELTAFHRLRASVDGEDPSQHGDLLVQVHGRIEDIVGGVPPDAESVPNGRREES